ncbi:BICD family-like cargo adapter 1 [Polypterus senegalus]|nr:BICD family-like cargo adapter 1 [Polypterus senegalus]
MTLWDMKTRSDSKEEELYSLSFEAQELREYQDLLAALKEKDEELVLAAGLGNALLSENSQLKCEKERLQEEHAERLEELQQDKHALRFELECRQAEWESQVCELERDAADLKQQVERLTHRLQEAERDKREAEQEKMAQNQKFQEQICEAMQNEKMLNNELLVLREQFREKAFSLQEEEGLVHSLKKEVLVLSEQKCTLEHQIKNVCEENSYLQASLSSLHKQITELEEGNREHMRQLHECQNALVESRNINQELQAQLDELREEASFHLATHSDTSLQSEITLSLESENASWTQEVEQVTRQIETVNMQLLPLVRGEDTDISTESGTSGSLHLALQHLYELVEKLVKGHSLQDEAEVKAPECERLLQQAIRDRDEAITKKVAMESELFRCKNDMMLLNNQLLEAVQRKLELSQELEAWQEDIQIIINQQLKQQQQKDKKRQDNGTSTSLLGFLQKPGSHSTEKNFFSRFRT